MYAWITPPDRSHMLAKVPPLTTREAVDAWIAKHKKKRAAKTRPGLLDNVPAFADMAELDAWIEQNKRPHVDHHPVTVTEAEWEWHRKNR